MNRLMAAEMAIVMGASVLGWAQETNKAASAKVPETVPASKRGLTLSGGGDVRFRDELKHELPGTGVAAKKMENMFRLRSRLWGSASFEGYTLYGRIANELRVYTARSGKNKAGLSTYDFPDELYLDSLYFDAKNVVGDRLDLRVGRQELKYGEGRILSDGSAADGARSSYFDAAKVTLHITEKTSLDAFGIFMDDYDDTAVGPYDRPMGTINTTYTDNEEAGAGLYLAVGEVKAFPFELYYVWKDETHSHNVGAKACGRDFHTFGTRLMPKLSGQLSAEVELAVQVGETDDGRDIFGYLGYGGLSYVIAPDSPLKPTVTPAVLFLSGEDKPNAGDDNNWNAVFNRTTWFSVLLSDQYKNYRWANLIYPHLAGSVSVLKNQKVKLHTGPVFCFEDDQTANGTGDTYKGYLTYARYEAPLRKGFFGQRSKLSHAVQLEVFEPGDYYETDETAVFLRWEVNAKF